MNKRIVYWGLVWVLCLCSCSTLEDGPDTSVKTIQIEVATSQSPVTRAHLLNQKEDIVDLGAFALSAYFSEDNAAYFEDAWVYYHIPDDGAAQWRFRDVANQDNLVNFYWPKDGKINFMAYLPRVITAENCAASISNIQFSATEGVKFSAMMPNETVDRVAADRAREHAKSEFMYACRQNQTKYPGPGEEPGSVTLRFVHPFAMIRFQLVQSHRDLTLHHIALHNLGKVGSFASNNDTYKVTNQDYLSHSNWTLSSTGDYHIYLDKQVPKDINYSSLIGGPYMVIPQDLKNVTLSVNYSWHETLKKETESVNIMTDEVPSFEPGKIYTYYIDLGDNKEEVLFKVTVEDWTKGEAGDYENNYEVK